MYTRAPPGETAIPRTVEFAAGWNVGSTAPVEVDSAAVVTLGGNEVALVVVTVSAPRAAAQSVSGSAVLRGDDADAVARAVLDALNRRLSG